MQTKRKPLDDIHPIHSIHVEKRKRIEREYRRDDRIYRVENNEAQPVGIKSRMRWWQEGYPDSLSKVPAQYLSTGVGARTARLNLLKLVPWW